MKQTGRLLMQRLSRFRALCDNHEHKHSFNGADYATHRLQ